jgi:hypothetical protein
VPIREPTTTKLQPRWDPAAGRLVYPDRPPTTKQVKFVAALCAQRGVPVMRPKTRREAASMIGRLQGNGDRTVYEAARRKRN